MWESRPFRLARREQVFAHQGGGWGDRRDGAVYVYDAEGAIERAVNVALVARRPLIVGGPSGSGKSSLALNVALCLGRPYIEAVVTGRSEADDLLWSFDAVARLADAQRRDAPLAPPRSYVVPGPLWWAFAPAAAEEQLQLAVIPGADLHRPRINAQAAEPAVVLIDELDKADPDFANSLLVPLGSGQITCPHIAGAIAAEREPLVFITTNNERELPAAFRRRCLYLELRPPTAADLVSVAAQVLPLEGYDYTGCEQFCIAIAQAVTREGEGTSVRQPSSISTAEYLDTVLACLKLGIAPDPADPAFADILRIAVSKQGASRDGGHE